MVVKNTVQRFVAGITIALLLLATLLILTEWSSGHLNTWLFETDLALLLMTIGISILVVNLLIVQVERRTQDLRARVPMSRVADRTRKGVETIVQFLIDTLDDERFVYEIFGSSGGATMAAEEFRTRLLGRAGNPALVEPEQFLMILNSMERNSQRLRSEMTAVGPVLSLTVAISNG